MASFDNPDSSKVDVARDQHEVSVANQQLENGDEDIFAEKDSELKKQKQARILSDKVRLFVFDHETSKTCGSKF